MPFADELAAELFSDGSPADLVERYARKLPLSVISELLRLACHADRPVDDLFPVVETLQLLRFADTVWSSMLRLRTSAFYFVSGPNEQFPEDREWQQH